MIYGLSFNFIYWTLSCREHFLSTIDSSAVDVVELKGSIQFYDWEWMDELTDKHSKICKDKMNYFCSEVLCKYILCFKVVFKSVPPMNILSILVRSD